MARTVYVGSRPGFIVDHSSINRNSGRQIDWTAVNASFVDPATGKKKLPAGTAVGEVTAGGKVAERVVTTRPAIGLLASDAIEDDRSAALSGYGVIIGGVVYENLLPDATGGPPPVLAAAIKTELNASGTGFVFEMYGDDRT
jgi:hypothetical protein